MHLILRQALTRGTSPFTRWKTSSVPALSWKTHPLLTNNTAMCSVIAQYSHDCSRYAIPYGVLSCRRFATKSSPDVSNECKDGGTGNDNKQKARIATAAPINQQAAKEILKQLSSPPNVLTASRIIATPCLSYMLLSYHDQKIAFGQTLDSTVLDATTNSAATDVLATIDFSSTPVLALSLFLTMGFTDFLDGYIARKFNYATVLGTYLDPFADKVFISVMSMTLWYTEALPGALVGLWVIRDVGMFTTAYWMVRNETMERIKNTDDGEPIAVMDPTKTPLKVEANLLSKVNTTLQIVLIALSIAGEVPSIIISPEFVTSLCWLTAGTTIGSSLMYLDVSAMMKSGNRSSKSS